MSELAILGGMTWYSTVYQSDSQPWFFIICSLLLFAIWFLDFDFGGKSRINLRLIIKHFYIQNQFSETADVQIVIHKKISKDYYVQYIDYYPEGGQRGRKIRMEKGLVRMAFRDATGRFSENFRSNEEKIDRLIDLYNYRKEEAMERITDRQVSYFCAPIIKNESIWGVLYMNAKVLYTFPENGNLQGSQFSKYAEALIKMIEHEID